MSSFVNAVGFIRLRKIQSCFIFSFISKEALCVKGFLGNTQLNSKVDLRSLVCLVLLPHSHSVCKYKLSHCIFRKPRKLKVSVSLCCFQKFRF